MKLILLVVAVLGVAALGSAQGETQRPTILANSMQQVGNVTHLKGTVEIRFGTIKIMADEADAHGDTGEFELRGNVRLLTR